MTTENTNLVLISGKTASGKSASLMNIKKPEGVFYANCENNKRLPFKSNFNEYTITDPYQLYELFDHVETLPETHTVITDTLTYLMDMFETVYIIGSSNTMKALTYTRAA